MENRESFQHSRRDWPDGQMVKANLATSPGCFRLRYIGLVISVSKDKNAILLRSPEWKFLSTWLARHAVRKLTCRRTSFNAVLNIDKMIISLSLPHVTLRRSSSLNNYKMLKWISVIRFCYLNTVDN